MNRPSYVVRLVNPFYGSGAHCTICDSVPAHLYDFIFPGSSVIVRGLCSKCCSNFAKVYELPLFEASPQELLPFDFD